MVCTIKLVIFLGLIKNLLSQIRHPLFFTLPSRRLPKAVHIKKEFHVFIFVVLNDNRALKRCLDDKSGALHDSCFNCLVQLVVF
jgi:hypothetical protein